MLLLMMFFSSSSSLRTRRRCRSSRSGSIIRMILLSIVVSICLGFQNTHPPLLRQQQEQQQEQRATTTPTISTIGIIQGTLQQPNTKKTSTSPKLLRREGQRRPLPSTRLYASVPEKSPPSSSAGSPRNNNNKRITYLGRPSAPGWKNPNQLDRLTDWAVNDEANRPVLCEYQPDGVWLWTRWKGTVLSMTYVPILYNILVGIVVDVAVHNLSGRSWPILATPPGDEPIIQQLQGLNSLWGYHVTLCTFVLTFFTAEAYKHWRNVYFTTRAIQGRINDVVMLVTVSAAQDQPASIELVTKLCRWIRLSHTFFWAATPTCSNGVSDGGEDIVTKLSYAGDDDLDAAEVAIGPLLLSADGLKVLVQAGELMSEEAEALLQSGLPPSQYTYILLEWVGIGFLQGLEAGLLGHRDEQSKDQARNAGLEENLLRQITSLRAEMFSIGDYQAGRMPLAYVQLVQVLVDSLVFLAPFSLYSELGTLSILLTGLLTLFFKGLLELSKSFLDPFGIEGYPGQNIRVDVLVSELNFGAASRWTLASQAYPLPPKAIVNGSKQNMTSFR